MRFVLHPAAAAYVKENGGCLTVTMEQKMRFG